jgi:hypothetical protein
MKKEKAQIGLLLKTGGRSDRLDIFTL